MTYQEKFMALDTDEKGNLVPVRDQNGKAIILNAIELKDAIAANFPFTFCKLEDTFNMIFRKKDLPKP